MRARVARLPYNYNLICGCGGIGDVSERILRMIQRGIRSSSGRNISSDVGHDEYFGNRNGGRL